MIYKRGNEYYIGDSTVDKPLEGLMGTLQTLTIKRAIPEDIDKICGLLINRLLVAVQVEGYIVDRKKLVMGAYGMVRIRKMNELEKILL